MATTSSELINAGAFTSGRPDSILAGVWRRILKDQKIDNSMLIEKITMYADGLKQVPPRRRSQIRGNMRTDVFKDGLTWYTFSKNLRALGITEITITFKCKHLRRHSEHTLKVPLDDSYVDKVKSKEDEDTSPLGPFLAEMMFNLGVDYLTFETLLEYYMQRMSLTRTPQGKNDLRAYIRKEFRSQKMSWNSLMNGFNFLCVMECEMVINLKQAYDFISIHHYKFALSDISYQPDLRENEDGI